MRLSIKATIVAFADKTDISRVHHMAGSLGGGGGLTNTTAVRLLTICIVAMAFAGSLLHVLES